MTALRIAGQTLAREALADSALPIRGRSPAIGRPGSPFESIDNLAGAIPG